jgi:hypothetical protein
MKFSKSNLYFQPPSPNYDTVSEGGGKRVGVKEPRDVARALRKSFTNAEVFLSIEGFLETIRDAFVTPHPDPLPQGERGDNF